MLKWMFGNKGKKASNKNLPAYEESRTIAASGTADKRQWLASQEGLQPEFLYLFATDEDEAVRVAVAGNDFTPLQADAILATDESEDVRVELAAKVSRLMPNLDPSGRDKVTEMVLEIVFLLAADRAVAVRHIVAEEIKSLDNMPEGVVEQLAWDAETTVSAPVLEFSPLLSERQLMEIIRSGVDGGALEAIARRHGLSNDVSAAVVNERHEDSMTCLLENSSANIAENSYETISTMAEESSKVLGGMIERDDLTLSTIRRIASFVGNSVINLVLERNQRYAGLDENMVREIRKNVHERVMSGGADEESTPGEEARERAEELFGDDKLDEKVLKKAIRDGERLFVIHALALLTGMPWEKVRDMINSKSSKPVVALAWKAELSAKMSVILQQKMARLTGSAIIRPTPEGEYSMTEDELEWFFEFMG
ncbi:MAG: DUF2336 domain-containing protein [Rhodospirillales bacterium]|jgi:uncharacterized protein (DUF2336 family)|nr:DUF2336 domain-containing protein [Rhodospirillales bacterium]MBT4039855.1 DUF2336 domain-containing protein [Rhodospirillales bacterium]MBT4628323.1 DUF2336 domain-containing protein [Rhodospirillales bacterium]MBT5350618.1 DUF2336 domain-containing protein [Rhodospirillales bacterium]MBT5521297.1 DUF2336 domain-containing protein [Rhodospirillales bacterium]